MLDQFFNQLVQLFHEAGCRCAVTGGLACIEFGIVEHTSDCDILCRPDQASHLLSVLSQSSWNNQACQFRGTMSAPLGAEWLQGGWTAHFSWGDEAYLDVFGAPPRVHKPWWKEEAWPFASRSLVAQMKRTRRAKDWSQATALGLQMIERGDSAGWYHLFDVELIEELRESVPPTDAIIADRPVLGLAQQRSPFLGRALKTEIEFWVELDKLRIHSYRKAARPYAALIRAHEGLNSLALAEQQSIRLDYARKALPPNPLPPDRVASLVEEARGAISLGLDPKILDFLPKVGPDFDYGGEF